MKVKIGKYKNHISIYTLTEKLMYLGIPERKCEILADWLVKIKWLDAFITKINDRRKRKINVKIDPYDVWSMDHTLSLIVAPMLKQLKEQKHGSGQVEDEDVPDEYQQADVHERWDWVLDEMIHAFNTIRNDETEDFLLNDKERKRVQNGLRLFAKYYFSLWD